MRELIIGGQRIMDSRKDWGFDRTKYLNSSEADQCIRQLWYAKHAPELEEEQEWGYAWRGHMAEEYVIRCLDARNDVALAGAGENQISMQEGLLSATPDGEIKVEDGDWEGLEVKSIDSRTNRNNLPKSEHITQFKIAMAIRNVDHPVPLKQGRLIYIDASNYNDIIEFVIEADDSILDVYAKKAAKVFRTKSADGLDREGKRNGGCKYCPFKETCGVTAEEAATGRQRVRRGSNLDAAAQEYMAIKEAQDAAAARLDGLKEDIRLGLQGRGKVIVGNIEVTLQAVKGRETLDKKAVAAAGIDLSPFTKLGAPSERLSLKRIQ